MKTSLKIFTASLFIIVLMACSYPQAQTYPPVKDKPEIHFIEDAWQEALKQAAAQNKYIFVDAYASWCGPCKMLKATTFKNDKVAAFYNKNFINISIDMEKGVGPSLQAQWQLTAYPTLIIFSPQGKPVLGTIGFLPANKLLEFGQQALAKKI